MYCSSNCRGLHSFPTRRSSDLGGDPRPVAARGSATNATIKRAFGRGMVDLKRSEEHTSELQSLRHLVCRLLLEKKKKNARHLYRVVTHERNLAPRHPP